MTTTNEIPPPTFRMRAGGSLIEARVELSAVYGEHENHVRADGVAPLGHLSLTDPAAERAAAAALLALGLAPDETGTNFVARGDAAIRFWSEGLADLPDAWILFVPEELVDTKVRETAIGVSVQLRFGSEGVCVDRVELRQCIADGKHFVRLEDGSFAPIDRALMEAVLAHEADLADLANKVVVAGVEALPVERTPPRRRRKPRGTTTH